MGVFWPQGLVAKKTGWLENLSATVKHQLATYMIWPLQLMGSDNGSNVGGRILNPTIFVCGLTESSVMILGKTENDMLALDISFVGNR